MRLGHRLLLLPVILDLAACTCTQPILSVSKNPAAFGSKLRSIEMASIPAAPPDLRSKGS